MVTRRWRSPAAGRHWDRRWKAPPQRHCAALAMTRGRCYGSMCCCAVQLVPDIVTCGWRLGRCLVGGVSLVVVVCLPEAVLPATFVTVVFASVGGGSSARSSYSRVSIASAILGKFGPIGSDCPTLTSSTSLVGTQKIRPG